MKKLLSIILALVMVLTLCTATVMAENEGEEGAGNPATTPTTGTITVTNAQWGVTYSAYRILDLIGGRPDNNGNFTAYSYKVNDAWRNFFYTSDGSLTETAAKYFDVAEREFVKAKSTFTDDSPAVVEFAKEALEYAKTLTTTYVVTPEKSEDETATSTNVEFKDIPLGYYLIDSNLGALCALDTTNPTVDITDKNSKPTLEKKVETNDGYAAENTVTVGKIFNFRIKIDNVKGAQNYVVYDKLSDGLTFVPYEDGQTVQTAHSFTPEGLNVIGADEDILVLVEREKESGGYQARKASQTDYVFTNGSVTDKNDNPYSFKIEFTQTFLNTLKDGEFIVIYYRARLNENAVIGNDGNPNEAKLEYGASFETEPSATKTRTWSFDVFKYTGENVPLSGAEFKLKTEIGQNEDGESIYYDYHFTKVDNQDGIPTYRACYSEDEYYPVTPHDDNDTTKRYDSIITDPNGKFRIIGLRGNSTYYLEEVKAPDGYNKLANPKQFTISTSGVVSNSTNNVIKVENNTGSEMPSTGSAGTKAFCIFGGLTMIISCVFLVTKKKMSVYED